MFKLLYLIIALLVFTDSYSQVKSQAFTLGPTGTVMKINDKGASALTYGNFIFGVNLEFAESSARRYEAINFHLQRGELENKISSPSQVLATQFQFEWRWLWNLNLSDNSSQLVGIHWRNDFTNTFRENFPTNSRYYCFSSSLSPEIMLKKSFVIKDRIHLSIYAKGSASLFGYVIRPSIASNSPIAPNEKYPANFWEKTISGRLVFFTKLNYFDTSYGIELYDNKRTFVAFEYGWNYFAYKIDNPYYEINHKFTVQIGFRLK